MIEELTPTPGLHEVEFNTPNALAAKVTGRHMGAVHYQVALYAEATRRKVNVAAGFDEDGSLHGVSIQDGDTFLDLKPGEYLILSEHNTDLCGLGEETFKRVWKPA